MQLQRHISNSDHARVVIYNLNPHLWSLAIGHAVKIRLRVVLRIILRFLLPELLSGRAPAY
jgi:hypothetical protein